MMRTWVMFMSMIGAGAGIAATAAPHAPPAVAAPAPAPVKAAVGKADFMPLDTCVRACLACDRTGNVLSCAVCAMCSQPAIAGSTM